MRLLTRDLPTLDLEEGSVIDGYIVEGPAVRHGERELICAAVGPDGEAASLLMALSPPAGRNGLSQFRRSAQLRAGLRHSALLPVRAVGIHCGRPYVATDAYPAETFADLLERSARSPEEVLTLLAPVCGALDLAHANGLVHQGLSSTSILVDDGGTLMLDTFGVVGGPERAGSEGEREDIRYSAPEQLYGEAISPATNVYSVACMLLESFGPESRSEGRLSARAYLQQVAPSVALSGITLGLGDAFDEVIRRAMALKPRDRPGSASELLGEVAVALGVALPAPSPQTLDRSSGRRASRGPRLLVATTIAAVVAGLAAGALIDPIEGSSSSTPGPGADAVALERLDDRRTPLRAALSASDTPEDQATVAAGLAAAYGRAAQATESPQVASAARAAELAYEELGAAAEAGAAERFASAADAVTRAEGQLAAAAAQPGNLQDARK